MEEDSQSIDKDKSELLTPKGRSQKILELTKELRALQQQSESKTIRPRYLKELKAEKEDLLSRESELQHERLELSQSILSSEKLILAWPIAKQYHHLTLSMQSRELPEWMTADWAQEWLELSRSLRGSDVEIARIKTELHAMKGSLAKSPKNVNLVEASETILRIASQVESLHDVVRRIDKQRTELKLLTIQKDQSIANLALKEDEKPLLHHPLGMSIKTQMQELVEPIKRATAERSETERTLRKRQEEHRDLEQRYAELTTASMDSDIGWSFEELERRFEAWQRSKDALAEVMEAEMRCRALQEKWNFPSNPVDSLKIPCLPAMDEIESLLEQEQRWEQEKLERVRELNSLEKLRDSLEASLLELDRSGPLPRLVELEKLRRKRDQIVEQWKHASSHGMEELPLFLEREGQEAASGSLEDDSRGDDNPHREPPSANAVIAKLPKGSTAKRVETSLAKKLGQVHREIDQMVDTLLRESHRVAKREQVACELENTLLQTERCRSQLARIGQERSGNDQAIAALWGRLGLPPSEASLLRQCLRDCEVIESESLRAHSLRSQFDLLSNATRQSLVKFATQAFADCDPIRLASESIEQTWSFVRRRWHEAQRASGQRDALRAAMQKTDADLQSLNAKLDEYDTKLSHLNEAFASWLQSVHLPSTASPAVAEQMIEALLDFQRKQSEIGKLEMECREQQDRVDGWMRRAMETLAQNGITADVPNWNEFTHWINRLASQTEEAMTEHRQRETLLIRCEERSLQYESLMRERSFQLARRQELIGPHIATTIEQIDQWARQASEYWGEQAEQKGLREQLSIYAPFDADLEPWIESLAQRDSGSLEVERDAKRERLSRIESQLADIGRQLGRNEQIWKGLMHDQPVADLAQQRQDLISRLEAASERWMAIVVAEEILHRALHRFHADQEQTIASNMVKYFRSLTDGNYVDVQQDDKKGESFLVIDRNGRSKHPDQLSTATREQLYLAIRFAHIHHYSSQNEPLPLILDDCFVNFDDTRLRLTLETLSEFAESQQVILLSCHRRTEAVAKEVRPSGNFLQITSV